MRRTIYFILFFIAINTAIAQELNDYDSLSIESKFYSKLRLDFKSSDYMLNYVSANLTLFPRNNEFQESSYELISNPIAAVSSNKDFILYKWDNPKETELIYGLDSKIKTKTNFKKIKEKIKFPIEEIPELEEYTKESETITSGDPKIKKKANELIEGEDDLYVIAHKIASWTKENINYSLETLTEDVSQNSSWVLENKKGVCDELTSLFVAMLRSVNIPSRMVSGHAYTNVLNGFGNHAWAEVYFPGYGWVPFDPTYGQIGYVDSTHIVFQHSIDIKEADVKYAWKSYGVEVDAGKLDIESKVITKGSLYKEDVKINTRLLNKEVGPGSYVPLEIEIENPNDYYLPITLYLTKAPKEIREKEKQILLKPKQVKKDFFIIEIPKETDKGFIYTSKVEVADSFQNIFSDEIKFSEDYNIYTLDDAVKKISQLKEEEKKIYSANVKIDCIKDKSFYYNYENVDISCTIKNLGNTNLNNLDICYLAKCNKIDLGIGEFRKFNISLSSGDVEKELPINARNQKVNKNLFLDMNIIKLPNLTIKNLNYPKKVNYNDYYKINYILSPDSEAKNVKIKLGKNEIFYFNSFKGNEEISIEFIGKSFYKKELDLLIDYQDQNNKSYSLKQKMDIQVERVPVYIEYWFIFLIILIIIISTIYLRKRR